MPPTLTPMTTSAAVAKTDRTNRCNRARNGPVKRSHGGMRSRHVPTTRYSGNPVQLSVTNLDYKMKRDEWNHYFLKSFSQVASILNIEFIDSFMQVNDERAPKSLRAIVTVSDESEANILLKRFHNKKVGYRRLQIQFIGLHSNAQSEQHQNIDLLKDRVLTLMSDDQIMTFTELYNLYICNYTDSKLSLADLLNIPDVVEIIDSTSRGIIVRLRRNPSNLYPNIYPNPANLRCLGCFDKSVFGFLKATVTVNGPPLSVFSQNVRDLLLRHEGTLDLSQFLVCYNTYFEPLDTQSESGVCLEHYISCVEGVEICTKHPTCAQSPENSPASFSPTSQTIKTVGLINQSPESNNRVFQDDCAVSSIIRTLGHEILKILEEETNCMIPACSFLNVYHRRFHRQLRVADYGCLKLSELFYSMPTYLQVIGSSNNEYLTLPHAVQLNRFKIGLRKTFRSLKQTRIEAFDVSSHWEKLTGKRFDPMDFGLTSFHDLMFCLRDSQEFKVDCSLAIYRPFSPLRRTGLDLTFEIINLMNKRGELRIKCPDIYDALLSQFQHFPEFSDIKTDPDLLIDYLDENFVVLSESQVSVEKYVSLTQQGIRNFLINQINSIIDGSYQKLINTNELKRLLFDQRHANTSKYLDILACGFYDVYDLLNNLHHHFEIAPGSAISRRNDRTRFLVMSNIVDMIDEQDAFDWHKQSKLCICDVQVNIKKRTNVDLTFSDVLSCLKGAASLVVLDSDADKWSWFSVCGPLRFAKILISIFSQRMEMLRTNTHPPGFTRPTQELRWTTIMCIYERKYGIPLDPVNYGCLNVRSLLDKLDGFVCERAPTVFVDDSDVDFTLSLTTPFKSRHLNKASLTDSADSLETLVKPTNHWIDCFDHENVGVYRHKHFGSSTPKRTRPPLSSTANFEFRLNNSQSQSVSSGTSFEVSSSPTSTVKNRISLHSGNESSEASVFKSPENNGTGGRTNAGMTRLKCEYDHLKSLWEDGVKQTDIIAGKFEAMNHQQAIDRLCDWTSNLNLNSAGTSTLQSSDLNNHWCSNAENEDLVGNIRNIGRDHYTIDEHTNSMFW